MNDEQADSLVEFVERLNEALGLTQEDVDRFNRLWNELIEKRKKERESE